MLAVRMRSLAPCKRKKAEHGSEGKREGAIETRRKGEGGRERASENGSEEEIEVEIVGTCLAGNKAGRTHTAVTGYREEGSEGAEPVCVGGGEKERGEERRMEGNGREGRREGRGAGLAYQVYLD